MSILVSGGAGYIGSHTCIELMKAGYEILVADNLYNSCEEALRRVERIAGQSVPFVNIDLCDAAAVDELFRAHPGIEAVIHFAAYKAVGESVAKPLEYYSNNLISALNVLNAMKKIRCEEFCVLLLRHCIRRPGQRAHPRRFPRGRHYQPLRRHQGNEREYPHRYLQGRPLDERGPAALFQPHRRA